MLRIFSICMVRDCSSAATALLCTAVGEGARRVQSFNVKY
jgi:hypothetical protein